MTKSDRPRRGSDAAFAMAIALAAVVVVIALTAAPVSSNPESILLDELAGPYVPVQFAHQAHAHWLAGDNACATCHHTTAAGEIPSGCSECHVVPNPGALPVDLGLKGAYHRSCLRCHLEWDRHTRCETCHARQKPEAMPPANGQRHYEPLALRGEIVFPTEFEEGDQVLFTHERHARDYDPDCTQCHREQRCAGCHARGESGYPLGRPGERDLHETCFQCHDEESCEDCHSTP